MKTIQQLSLLGVALLAFFGTAQAQRNESWRNDPTYSTGNYKHANKAAAARRAQAATGIAVQAPAAGSEALADYKKGRPNQAPAGGITVDHTPSVSLADRNYKIQRVSPANNTEPADAISRKRNRKADDSTSVGD
ncbi:hypothetical protein [Spirosoma luteolum]